MIVARGADKKDCPAAWLKSSPAAGNFPAGGAFDTILPKVVTVPAENDPLRDLDPKEAIDLRWTLRDIKAKRWKLSPINPTHLEKLKAMGLVELRNDEPVLTNAGFDAIP
jgi:hypothetical protein